VDRSEFLRHALTTVESLNIPHMIVGSIASMRYGEARLTLDIDIVCDLDVRTVEPLCAAFSDPEFYVSLPAALDAVRSRKQFNVIHSKSGLKIDFMISRNDEWGRMQLARRRKIELMPGQLAFVASPEDVILGKLQYYKERESHKHLRDIAAMLQVSGDQIDRSDVSMWATKLGVLDIWQAIVDRVDSATKLNEELH